MASRRSVLVVIPARGGSKRLPRKNVLPLCGKPLIAWTIEAARQSMLADNIIVTSDDDEILSIAKQYGAISIKRSAALASDEAKTLDVVIECVELERQRGFDYDDVILLQPTSPLRTHEDIIAAYELYVSCQLSTVVSVCKVEHPVDWCGRLGSNNVLEGIDFLSQKRSQDVAPQYRLNGAVYIFSAVELLIRRSFYTPEVFACVMPQVRSIDIDEQIDFEMCEFFAARQTHEKD